ncbi:hypothetical protein V2J56_09055 [Georgenia sp. MJ206]|uniref:hypothetical protein n=1 Tax=Georgenia wangjunii TaxID=3117730 RepID=UPI002F2642D1
MALLKKCRDCGGGILLALYVPDRAARTPSALEPATSWIPLHAEPAPRTDPSAGHAVFGGRMKCHLITDNWPLADHEKRHHVHRAVCPGRATATEATATTEGA